MRIIAKEINKDYEIYYKIKNYPFNKEPNISSEELIVGTRKYRGKYYGDIINKRFCKREIARGYANYIGCLFYILDKI
jgi:hypothetical protein